MRDIQPVLLSGVSKGACPLAHDFAKQSVVCYTLCRRCRENAVAAGEGKGIFTAGKQGCDCVAWSRKRRTGFISRQGVYESPVPRPMPDYGTKCPSRIATPTKKRTDFLLKIGMGGKAILGFSRLDCLSAKTGGAVNGGAFMRRSS